MKTMKQKPWAVLLILVLVLTLFTGCAEDPAGASSGAPSSSETPVSSVPTSSDAPSSDPSSSEIPVSSAPSSQPPVSSEPEKPKYPKVNLKGPKGLEAMTCTITQYAYIDKNGVLRYSPAHKETAKEEETITYKKYIAADGTKGVRSLAYNGYGGLYVLLNNGNVRYTESLYMDTNPLMYIHKETNVSAFRSWWVYSAFPAPYEYAMLRYDAKGNGTITTNHWNAEKIDYKKTGVAQVVGHDSTVPSVLYTDGTVRLASVQSTTLSTQREEVAEWKNVVQIVQHNGHLIGLQKDGTLLCACTTSTYEEGALSLKQIPEGYRTHTRRIFQDGYLQRSDGAVYDLNQKKELGVFPMMDQIFSYEYNHVLGVDTTGKVHDLTRRVPSKWEADTMEWLLSLTNVKTVWGD
ncbi:MAG: hypothetical protein IJY28_07435 [Clostridia bacterium]|nr:hypothetical protein [Clostridia bacterium]